MLLDSQSAKLILQKVLEVNLDHLCYIKIDDITIIV